MITEHPQQLTLDDTTEPVDIDTPPVLAAHAWPTNAHLIADVAHLGYLTDTDRVIDPTYGRGIWWQRWRPADLTAHDIRADGIDFRDLPHPSGRFDAAAYDPPYVCVGGRRTTTVPDLHDRYGLTDAPNTPAELLDHIAPLRPPTPKGTKAPWWPTSPRMLAGAVRRSSPALRVVGVAVDTRRTGSARRITLSPASDGSDHYDGPPSVEGRGLEREEEPGSEKPRDPRVEPPSQPSQPSLTDDLCDDADGPINFLTTVRKSQPSLADDLCDDCGYGPDDSDDRDYCETCGGGNPFS